MSLAEQLVDDFDDLCPHGKVICTICAAEEDEPEHYEEDDDDDT